VSTSKCSQFFSFLEVCLQCSQNFLKIYQVLGSNDPNTNPASTWTLYIVLLCFLWILMFLDLFSFIYIFQAPDFPTYIFCDIHYMFCVFHLSPFSMFLLCRLCFTYFTFSQTLQFPLARSYCCCLCFSVP